MSIYAHTHTYDTVYVYIEKYIMFIYNLHVFICLYTYTNTNFPDCLANPKKGSSNSEFFSYIFSNMLMDDKNANAYQKPICLAKILMISPM